MMEIAGRYGQSDNTCNCRNCCPESICPICLDNEDCIPLAMVYVKNQEFSQTFDPMKGLCAGTIFPQLYKPWMVPTRGCIR